MPTKSFDESVFSKKISEELANLRNIHIQLDAANKILGNIEIFKSAHGAVSLDSRIVATAVSSLDALARIDATRITSGTISHLAATTIPTATSITASMFETSRIAGGTISPLAGTTIPTATSIAASMIEASRITSGTISPIAGTTIPTATSIAASMIEASKITSGAITSSTGANAWTATSIAAARIEAAQIAAATIPSGASSITTTAEADTLAAMVRTISADNFARVSDHYKRFLPTALEGLQQGYSLPTGALHVILSATLNGLVPTSEIKEIVSATSNRLPTAEELTGGAMSLRGAMQEIGGHTDAIDIVGTGGDGHNTFNISTATALVVAAAGAKVAKHGNRSASSRSGAADVLEALGVNLAISPQRASDALHEVGIAFLFAQTYHPAMKILAGIRRELGKKTIFNLLGPLANPADAKNTLLGVYSEKLMGPMADALRSLGVTNAWIVHGEDGLDEITTTGKTRVLRLNGDGIEHSELLPEDFNIPRAHLSSLKGGDAQDNARAITELFDGKKSAFRDIVLFNAAVALKAAAKVESIRSGVEIAADTIDTGKARRKLNDLVQFSHP